MKISSINLSLVTIASCMLSTSAFAQQGQWAFGNDGTADRGHRITPLVGDDLVSVSNEAITRHDGTSTTIQWQTSIPGFHPFDVIQASDGRIVVVGGQFMSDGTSTTTLVFLDAAGYITGFRQYPGHHAFEKCELIQTSDGGFLIAGEVINPAVFTHQPFLIKTDANGIETWMRRYNDPSLSNNKGEFSCVVETQTDDGQSLYHLTGFYQADTFTSWDTLMMTVDGSGDLVNAVALGFDNHSDFGRGLIPYQDGFLVTGYSKQLGEGGGTYLMRLNSNFQVLWYYGTRAFQGTREIHLTADDHAILAGTTGFPYPIQNACMLDVDLTLPLTGTGMQYGGPISDSGADFAVDASGFTLLGETNSFGTPAADQYLVRVDGTFSSGCNESEFKPDFIPQQILRTGIDMAVTDIPSINQSELKGIFPEYFEEPLCDPDPEPCECFPPPPDMTGWWTMDESSGSVVAESIAGLDGTRIGAPITITGMVGNALEFDGVDDHVSVPYDSMLDVGFANAVDGDFTIDAWIRIDGPDPMEWGPIASMNNQCNGFAFYVRNDRLELACSDGPLQAKHVSFNTIPHDEWVHVAVVADRPGYPRFYINGVEELAPTSGVFTLSGLGTSPTPFQIGRLFQFCAAMNSQVEYFRGGIDEVEFFHRALDASEIQGIHGARECGKCKISCDPPWDRPFCLSDTSIQVTIPVCNASAAPADVQLDFTGLDPSICGSIIGPTGFTVLSPGNPLVIPGNQCVNVVVEIDRPAGMNALNQVGCYELTVTNLDNGTSSTCRGSVQDRRDLCPITPDLPVEVAIDDSTVVAISFENTDFEAPVVEWRAVAYGPDMTPSGVFSLDGREPGTYAFGEVETMIGETGRIDLRVEALAFERGLSDLVFFTRNGDDFVPLTSVALRTVLETPCVGDYNNDGEIDGNDLGVVLGAWGTNRPDFDLTGDGFIDGQDLATILGNWGVCAN